ncbi:DUF2235 domain-containing protein [Tabrizicola thermarum]|uniref:DUF2235 domain-containing protein n=1 Tax=Tabrizicola thermarum TaxID=2670345 RepID=UPI000FFB7EC9|nr:DUF2235 domain-containing protein [Tabrizicola thermarum]
MHKRLVVCFDGTWNAADSERSETNVVRLSRAVRANSGTDGVPQLCIYLRGVGTSGSQLERLVAGATGAGTEDIIRTAYLFLAQNYVPGDEIFLFGYSRGAFAARSLTGLLGSAGLLKRQSLGHLDTAWAYYRDFKKRSPADFLNRYAKRNVETHTDVTVTFLGVWDTVGALGIPVGFLAEVSGIVHGFHDTSPSKIVRHGVQALAIDEHRDEFVPTLWTGEAPAGSTIEQVWFAGCHGDVGGGYSDRELADIPLLWMIDRAKSAGLQIDETSPGLLPQPAAINVLGPTHDSRQGWSMKDRLTPTIRSVCEQNVAVDLLERLYRPLGPNGKPIRTINEMIHWSVVERYGKPGLISPDDRVTTRKRMKYAPKSLKPLFDATDQPLPGTKVWTGS